MVASYRYEVAKQGRAICQNSACKKESIKIPKGELRFGSLVTIPNYGDSWKWKHWGCVTPLQISNIIDQIGGLDGLDLDKDLDILDGYEELEDWAQKKVKDALVNGHVDDEDWKGDPELNRPGQKGINKRTPKKKDGEDGSADGSAVEDSPAKPKKGGRKKKATASEEDDHEPAPKKKAASKKRKSAEDDEDGQEAAPAKKRAARGKKAAVKDEDEDEDAEEAKPVKKRAAKSKKPPVKDESEDEPAPEPPKRASRGRKVKQEPEPEPEAEAEADNVEEPIIPQTDGSAEVAKKKTGKKATAKKGSKRAAPADDDDDDEQHDEPEAPAPKTTKAGRSKKAKTEPASEEVTAPEPAPKPAKASRSKATKAAPKDDDGEVLDAGDKKKQARRGRGKKANVVVPVPEDEHTDAAQPEEVEAPIAAAEGDIVEVEAEADEPAKKEKKKGRLSRTARRSSSKAEKA